MTLICEICRADCDGDCQREAAGRVLSVGALAKLLQVAPLTISRWMDRGLLDGYRLPGTGKKPGHRRIRFDSAWRFCKEHGMPTDRLAGWLREKVGSCL